MTLIQLRRGTAAAWTGANPTLAAGEPGVETDTDREKIGDGATAWNELAYQGGGLLHVAVPIAFDTADLSTPSGAIPGVHLYTPAIGDILLDAWLQLDVVWDVGAVPGAWFDLGTFVGVAAGLFGAADSFGQSKVTVRDSADTEDAGTGLLFNDVQPSLSQALATAWNGNSNRGVPALFTATNPLLAVVSDDGTNTGNDPGAGAGSGVAHLLIIPA